MKAKKSVDTKPKKPNYKKTETFQDYKSAAATFADYNPGTDTVFVGTSIDPGMAHKKANRDQSISYSKGASGPYSEDQKMYQTKNESGQTVYVALNKTKKKQYSKGGIMKAKKKKPAATAKPASRVPKGEIDLGSTVASKRKLTLGEAQELNRRTTDAYGRDPMDIRSGNPGLDARNDRYESEKRQARARAGNKFYDGDGGGDARREKDYADELENRIDAKMMMEKIKSKQYKSGGKIYKKGGSLLSKALKKKYGKG